MSLLTPSEALLVSDSFLLSLYGDDIFIRWKQLKDNMNFTTQREYVSWMIDVAERSYRDTILKKDKMDYYQNNLKPGYNSDINFAVKSDVVEEVNVCEVKQEVVEVLEVKNVICDHGDTLSDKFDVPVVSDCRIPEQQVETTNCCNRQDVRTESGHSEQNVNRMIKYYDQSVKTGSSDCEQDLNFSSNHYEQDLSAENSNYWVPELFDKNNENQQLLNTPCGSKTQRGDRFSGVSAHPYSSSQHRQWPLSKKYPCPHCNYGTNNSSHLDLHIKGVHERVKPYQCRHCNLRCSQQTNLNRHLVRKHGYASKHKCANCEQGFISPSALNKHVCRVLSVEGNFTTSKLEVE